MKTYHWSLVAGFLTIGVYGVFLALVLTHAGRSAPPEVWSCGWIGPNQYVCSKVPS